VVLALLLSGCGVFTSGDDRKALPKATLTPSPIGSTGASATVTAKPQLDRFYEQKLAWKPCRNVFRCATLKVPLDYADPEGKVISVALLKVPAASPSRRLGSLVVDPGGPGASGVDYAASGQSSFGPELLQASTSSGSTRAGSAAAPRCAARTPRRWTRSTPPTPTRTPRPRPATPTACCARSARAVWTGAATWRGTCPPSRSPRTSTCCVRPSGTAS
jgi:hypothetical protein